MKRYFISTALIFCLGVLCLADEPTFNVEKSRQEFEIMKGILETSLAFSLSDEETVKSTFRVTNVSNIDAFYLSGQGAVFMIPTSSFYRSGGLIIMPEFSEQMSTLNEKVRILTQNLALQSEQLASKAQEWNQTKSGIGPGKGAGVGSGVGSGQGSELSVRDDHLCARERTPGGCVCDGSRHGSGALCIQRAGDAAEGHQDGYDRLPFDHVRHSFQA